jgi:hypothetical protein
MVTDPVQIRAPMSCLVTPSAIGRELLRGLAKRTCWVAPLASNYDSNADGMGDLRGIVDKLDYCATMDESAVYLTGRSYAPAG